MSDTQFKKVSEQVFEFGRRIAGVVPDRQADIDEQLQDLRENRFEVAVIGVIKAGKSTLLNALINRPKLLPANVNPWTAVITKLCFDENGEREGSATFSFFDQSEWESQPEDSRGTLTPEMKALFGESHVRTPVTGQMLEEYLAAGDPDQGGTAGRYTTITKEATLSFGLPPFDTRTMIVDTPGTNDPNVARSAVTEDYLARAHAFVLMMPATQAYTNEDNKMIQKLLTALHKTRLTVVVNQIDRLQHLNKDSAAVKKRVTSLLSEMYPKHNIKVITTSAWWGECATLGPRLSDKQKLRFLHSEELVEFAESSGRYDPNILKRWTQNEQSPTSEEVTEAMLACSGIPEVRRTIQETLMREKGRALIEGSIAGLRARSDEYQRFLILQSDQRKRDADALRQDVASKQKRIAEHDESVEALRESVASNDTLNADEYAEDVWIELGEMIYEELSTAANDGIEELIEYVAENLEEFGRGVVFVDYVIPTDTIKDEIFNRWQQVLPELNKKMADVFKDATRSIKHGAATSIEADWADYSPTIGKVLRGFRVRSSRMRLLDSETEVVAVVEEEVTERYLTMVRELADDLEKKTRSTFSSRFNKLKDRVNENLKKIIADHKRSRKELEGALQNAKEGERVSEQHEKEAERSKRSAEELGRISEELARFRF